MGGGLFLMSEVPLHSLLLNSFLPPPRFLGLAVKVLGCKTVTQGFRVQGPGCRVQGF